MELSKILGGMAAMPIANEFLKAISPIIECGINHSDFLKRKELKHAIMEEYAHDTRIPAIERCAIIDNWNTIAREYANKVNIVGKAISYLDEQKKIQSFDTDWLLSFFEKAKNISNDEMQMIWAKLLAEEAQTEHIPKSLLNSLSITEGYQAKCFENICQYCMETRFGEVLILPIDDRLETLTCFDRDVLEELDDLGYIKLLQMGYENRNVFLLHGSYCNKEIRIENTERGISVGQVSFTKNGKILASIIERRYDENFIKMLQEFCDKEKYTLSIAEA